MDQKKDDVEHSQAPNATDQNPAPNLIAQNQDPNPIEDEIHINQEPLNLDLQLGRSPPRVDQKNDDVEHSQAPNATDQNQAPNLIAQNQDPNPIEDEIYVNQEPLNLDLQLGRSTPRVVPPQQQPPPRVLPPQQQPLVPDLAQPLNLAEGPRMWYDCYTPTQLLAVRDLYRAFGLNIRDRPSLGQQVAPRVQLQPLSEEQRRRRIFPPLPRPYSAPGQGLTWSQVSTPSQLLAMQNFYRSLGAEFVVDWQLPVLYPIEADQITARQGNYSSLLLAIFYEQIGRPPPSVAAQPVEQGPRQPQQEQEDDIDGTIDVLNSDHLKESLTRQR